MTEKDAAKLTIGDRVRWPKDRLNEACDGTVVENRQMLDWGFITICWDDGVTQTLHWDDGCTDWIEVAA